LTYMSIDDEIIDRVRRGMLFPLVPRAKGEVPTRAFFVGEKMWGDLTASYEDQDLEYRMGELQAHLDHFASGGRIGPKYLRLLHPACDGVWEIRNPEADPSMRVIGLFVRKDVFIAAEMAFRKDLDGWQSRRWKEVKRRASAVWRGLFFNERPLVTVSVNEVVSGAEDGRYYKNRA